ncbi:MAG: hypothetical protein KW802_04465 [Candidatus Doudnabacteria bacterium]|nr:hypothetical protein [Candidatus Doudnabacteria bacterium]
MAKRKSGSQSDAAIHQNFYLHGWLFLLRQTLFGEFPHQRWEGLFGYLSHADQNTARWGLTRNISVSAFEEKSTRSRQSLKEEY